VWRGVGTEAAVGEPAGEELSIHTSMSPAEDGYCSADSPRADSGDEHLAAARESPRARAGQNKRERDVPSPSSPLPAAKRRYELFSSFRKDSLFS
jgi:hypothetical protein